MELDAKVVENALRSVIILNKEMGGVLASISWLKTLIMWQFGLISATFVAVLSNILLTRRNGRAK